MKIAIIADWYSDDMGYAENYLPMALGRLGHEVHLLTSNFQVYANSPKYDQIYRSKLGERQVSEGVWKKQFFTLHRLRGWISPVGVHVVGLDSVLRRLRPDIVYCFEINSPSTGVAARHRRTIGYGLFCESRLHASVFPPPSRILSRIKLWLKNSLVGVADVIDNVERFYPIAPDVQRIITQHFGVPSEKCSLSSLAVETDIFSPRRDAARIAAFRSKLGLSEGDLLCVYTGRLTPGKGPLVLGKAVDLLQRRGSKEVRGLFVGEGEESYRKQISECSGCMIHPFVKPAELADIFRSADVGVWPLQESTSQLDAMACGLPIIVNDTVNDPLRLGECSLTFSKDSPEALAGRILELRDPARRAAMGRIAAARIAEQGSWDALARKRAHDFEVARAAAAA